MDYLDIAYDDETPDIAVRVRTTSDSDRYKAASVALSYWFGEIGGPWAWIPLAHLATLTSWREMRVHTEQPMGECGCDEGMYCPDGDGLPEVFCWVSYPVDSFDLFYQWAFQPEPFLEDQGVD